MRVDIDEPAVDLALRRTLAQCVDCGTEWCVVEHGSVDQDGAFGSIDGVLPRQNPREKGVASAPCSRSGLKNPVEFADHERRERAREARGRARRERQLRGIGERLARDAVIAERNHDAVFRLDHFRGRMERQAFRMPPEIGDGDEQIERLAGGSSRGVRGAAAIASSASRISPVNRSPRTAVRTNGTG